VGDNNNMATEPIAQWVGPECGHHATYTFYKAVKYRDKFQTEDRWRVLSLGQFFFVKIWPANNDLLSVAELQLLWEDKSTGQMMSSVRLYFLPEYTLEGRQPHHGEDELIGVAEKSVLRVPDLLDWLANPKTLNWDRGTRGAAMDSCSVGPESADCGNQRLGPGPGLDLSEVDKVRAELGDLQGQEEKGVVVVSAPQYCRFRAVLKRLDGVEKRWMRNSLVMALGGFATKTRNTFVMFAKEIFDYPELEEHPLLCNHLAPKLKGRPRKRRKVKEAGSGVGGGGGDPNSPEDGSELESNSSEGSNKAIQPPVAKSRKDLLAILSQKNTKEETEFLKKLIKFMESRHTPIERPPMLGFKQIDLHLFFKKVVDLGGYDGCVSKKSWKSVYDELGGNPQNTSAATCTRRHYEKFLLSYEKYLKNLRPDQVEEMDEKNEKTFDDEDKKTQNGTSGENGDLAVEDEEEIAEPVVEQKPKIGIKPLQFLTDPEAVAKSEMNEDCGGKMKIDDLIIIPNNINHAEEGGSALQNLAKIASRYSSLNKDKARAQDFTSPNAKKARVETSPGVAQPLPPTSIPKKPGPGVSPVLQPDKALSSTAATNLLQHFSLLSPGVFPGWPGPRPPGPTSSSSSTASSGTTPTITSNRHGGQGWMGSGYNLDQAKIGQEGYNLLKYYEQQLKALQGGSSTSPTKLSNGSKEGSTGKTKEAKREGKEKLKVSKPPPETKRPPRLLATPCPYLQTASIYGSPQSDLQKAREVGAAAASTHNAQESVVDLSSSSAGYKAGAPAAPPAPRVHPPVERQGETSSPGRSLSNNSRPPSAAPPAAHQQQPSDLTVDLTTKPPVAATPPKASPFSAEALLSKAPTPKSLPPLSMGIKGILEGGEPRPPSQHASPSPRPRASPSLPPSSSFPGFPSSSSSSNSYSKPAAPVPPNPRASQPSSLSLASLAYYSSATLPPSLAMPPSTSSLSSLGTETTFSSLSSLPTSSLQPSNPYLSALMGAPGLHPSPTPPKVANSPYGPAGLSALDPASQYYAALYQQQMSAYQQQAAVAAALGPYGQAALGRGGAGYPGGAAEMAALQQYKDMMTRAAMSTGGSSAAAAAAAAMSALGPNASAAAAAMSALAPSASVAASMNSLVSGHQASAAGLSSSAANSAAATSYAALYAGLMGQSGLMGFPPGVAPPGFPSPGAPRKE